MAAAENSGRNTICSIFQYFTDGPSFGPCFRLMFSGPRTRVRAMRRAKELLKQIEPQKGARTDLQPTDGGDSKLMQSLRSGHFDHSYHW
jgi:hypothetical protein